MIVLLACSQNCLVGVCSNILVEGHDEVKMSMHWSDDSHNGWFLQFESHLVSLVVPQVVDSVALSVVEIFLFSSETGEISVSVKSEWKLFSLALVVGQKHV